MTGSTVDVDQVARICGAAAPERGAFVEALHDPLDNTTWVLMSDRTRAREALTALHSVGIGGHDLDDGRLHVTGWDVRLLHWRLGVLLAAVDDLTAEWSGTAELACYHHDRRAAAGLHPDPTEVLADVETTLRSCRPLPHPAPSVTDIGALLQLCDAAEDAYQQLIAEHIDHAEHALIDHAARHKRAGAA